MPGQSVNKRAGRRTICTPDIARIIATQIILGLSIEDSCKLAGVPSATHYVWMKKGELENEDEYHAYKEVIDKARAQFKLTILKQFYELREGVHENVLLEDIDPKTGQLRERIVKKPIVKPEWLPGAWLLERLYPQEFGKHDPSVIIQNNNQVMLDQMSDMSRSEIDAILSKHGYSRGLTVKEKCLEVLSDGKEENAPPESSDAFLETKTESVHPKYEQVAEGVVKRRK